ncbi:MAG: hypothetical protein L0323_23365, partial [Planctomycetes bacterium]|nr:hypothetical protein [Planctomycetota bacterium]
LALWSAAPPAAAHDDGVLSGESDLLPPEGSPQPDARGEVEVESGLAGQSFEVEVTGAALDVELTAFLDDGTGVLQSIGTLTAEEEEGVVVLELEFDTAAGATLPNGVATVDLLAGLAVEVRDGTSAVVLAGVVPALGTGDDDGEDDDGDDDGDDDDGDDDNDDNDGPRARGRAILMLAESSPFPDAEGEVEVEVEGDEEELEIEAEHLDAGTAVEFFLADADGNMTSIGTATADEEGEAEIEFETEEGGSLPLGAASVADLAGRRVEVRASDGTLILFGAVPEATTRAQKLRCRGDVMSVETRARVRVTALVDNRSGRERLNVELKAVSPGATEAELFLDDGGGTLTLADTVPLKRSGRGRARYDTKKGQPLPLGASSVRDLQGRAFEIRVEGAAVLAGNFPNF